jgi:GNAT superfamily N-acetyltransferase
MPTIRVTQDRDGAEVVRVQRELDPLAVVDARTWLYRRRTVPARARALSLVAEADGEIVGRAEGGLNWFARGNEAAVAWVGVLPADRGRGLGSEPFQRVARHALALGAVRLTSTFNETADGKRFATRRGFREIRAEVQAVIDPRVVEVDVGLADVISVREARPEDVHAVDDAATADMPASEQPASFTFDEWLGHVWNYPMFSRDGSFAAVADGRIVAVALLNADLAGRRAVNTFTGTLREYRGRGLALATKVASLRWAAKNGITQVVTSNDESNTAMLAINRRLGYLPAGRSVEYGRDL